MDSLEVFVCFGRIFVSFVLFGFFFGLIFCFDFQFFFVFVLEKREKGENMKLGVVRGRDTLREVGGEEEYDQIYFMKKLH